jgi:hypothetical protein
MVAKPFVQWGKASPAGLAFEAQISSVMNDNAIAWTACQRSRKGHSFGLEAITSERVNNLTLDLRHSSPTAQWSRKSFGQLAAGKPDPDAGLAAATPQGEAAARQLKPTILWGFNAARQQRLRRRRGRRADPFP